AALLRAARSRRIPARTLTPEGLLNLGHGKHQRRLHFTQTDRTSTVADAIARDRALTLSLLGAEGLPVPEHEIAFDAAGAWEAAEEIGLPVVVSRANGAGLRKSRRDLQTRDQVLEAYADLAGADGKVLVQKQAPGHLWRLLIVGERMVAATLTHCDQTNG